MNLILNNVDEDLPIVMTLGNHDTSLAELCPLFYEKLGPRFYSNIDDLEAVKNDGTGHAVIGGYHFITLEGEHTYVALEGLTSE